MAAEAWRLANGPWRVRRQPLKVVSDVNELWH